MDKHWLIKSLEQVTYKKGLVMISLVISALLISGRDTNSATHITSDQFKALINDDPTRALAIVQEICKNNNLIIRNDMFSSLNRIYFRYVDQSAQGGSRTLAILELPSSHEESPRIMFMNPITQTTNMYEGCGLTIGTLQYVDELAVFQNLDIRVVFTE